MIILKNHFNGKNTYIIGKHIINGCQTFTIEDLHHVGYNFGASYDMLSDVERQYNKNINDEPNESIYDFINKDIPLDLKSYLCYSHNLKILILLEEYVTREFEKEIIRFRISHHNPFSVIFYRVLKHFNKLK